MQKEQNNESQGFNELLKRICIAYKKLKASVYFDKYMPPLRDKIVEFETDQVDDSFSTLCTALLAEESIWKEYEEQIKNKVNVLVLPKKLEDRDKNGIIFNTDGEPVQLEKAQYFIDLPITGHILGVLWVLSVGLALDNPNNPDGALMYEHSYGNRLRKTLINPDSEDITYSPNLFEPYFIQYESWRDKALQYAKSRLDDKQDALILTLDFKSFYYSVDIQEEEFEKLFKYVKTLEPWQERVYKRIHAFVYAVLCAYSDKIREISTDMELQIGKRTILPIGFLPSKILSNWALTPFDDAIIKRWNPVYYGRYVDDIIIVDKVEKNSPLQKKANEVSKKYKNGEKITEQTERLTREFVINYYFCSCPASRTDCPNEQELFIGITSNRETPSEDKKTPSKEQDKTQVTDESSQARNFPSAYKINPAIFSTKGNPDIQIQDSKVRVFYFRKGASRALLDCFHTQIAQNASGFNYLPEMDTLLNKNDYSEIFHLQREDSIHKLRGVAGVELDKFSLSKFLGKYRQASGMIRDKKETVFDRDLLTILDRHALIENHTLWERLLEIMIVNDRLTNYQKLITNILETIVEFHVPDEKVKTSKESDEALLRTLRAAICRTAALRWGPNIKKTLKNIEEAAMKTLTVPRVGAGALDEFCIDFSYDSLLKTRKNYCTTRMINKYVIPLPIDCLLGVIFSDELSFDVCLYKLEDVVGYLDAKWEDQEYHYYPYMVTPQELSFALTCQAISSAVDLPDPIKQREKIETLYREWNYPNLRNSTSEEDGKKFALDKIKVGIFRDCSADEDHCGIASDDENKSDNKNSSTSERTRPEKFKKDTINRGCYAISIGDDSCKKLKVSIGNARLTDKDFYGALTGKANRSFERYQQLSDLLRAAIKEKVDLLVLPESYLPWEWVPDIARLCARNQMGLITGIEHIVSPAHEGENKKQRKVYNLTAIILPYRQENYEYAYITYHQKVHYSPEEKRIIKGYRFVPIEGNAYHLFYWRDVWFSVYCCYELASIQDRALFQSYADLTVAVEWNRDTNYFSSIIESLCRDLHCFCIQANSSDYGDSRVTSPSPTEKRDLIKTKGGKNSAILVDEIDIDALREFQRKEYELQHDDDTFKPTPPNFRPDIVERKQNHTLWKYVFEQDRKKAD